MEIKLTEQELAIVLAALQELPYKASAGVIGSIRQQIEEKRKKVTKDEKKR